MVPLSLHDVDHVFRSGLLSVMLSIISSVTSLTDFVSLALLFLLSLSSSRSSLLLVSLSPSSSSSDVFLSPSVRRLSAAASGEDPAQHGDGESRRWLDGSGRVPGQK